MAPQPKTLDEAVDFVLSLMGDSGKEDARTLIAEDKSMEQIVAMIHHGFGTYVRNTLKLWHDESGDLRQDIWNNLTPEKQKFYADWWKGKGDHQGRTMHADDASSEILDRVLTRLVS